MVEIGRNSEETKGALKTTRLERLLRLRTATAPHKSDHSLPSGVTILMGCERGVHETSAISR